MPVKLKEKPKIGRIPFGEERIPEINSLHIHKQIKGYKLAGL